MGLSVQLRIKILKLRYIKKMSSFLFLKILKTLKRNNGLDVAVWSEY